MTTARGSRGERDDDLLLFHEMQRREREKKHSLPMPPVAENQHSDPNHANLANPTLYRMPTSTTAASVYRGRTSGEELLASDMGKNDYDWLMTPPGTPLVTNALENEPLENAGYISSQKGLPNLVKSLSTIKTNRISRESSTMASRSDPTSRMTRGGNFHNNSPAGGPRRSSLAPTIAASSSVLSSRSNSSSRPLTPSRSRPTNSSSTTNGNTSILAKSSTVTSSTRPGVSSRSTTPLRRPSTPVMSQGQAAPVRSSSANRASSLPSRNTPASRGSSPTVRATASRPWQPSAMPGFSLEPPPNLRTTTSLVTRSVSNSRGASISSGKSSGQPSMGCVKPGTSSSPSLGPLRPRTSSSPSLGPLRPGTPTKTRPGTPSKTGASRQVVASSFSSSSTARTSMANPWPAPPSPSSTTSSKTSESILDRSRRQSSSPSVARGRASTSERPLSRNGRSDSNPSDIIAGRSSKMVDRMNPSRRITVTSTLSPEEMPALQTRRSVKPTTPTIKDRSLPRKSIDMALRNMDIRQNGTSGIRSLVPNMSSSSTSGFYGVVRSVGRVRTGHSASSTASSEHSISIARDLEGSELGEEVCSELGSRASPRSVSDYREDSVELMQLFRSGIEKLSGVESPLVCQHGNNGGGNCDLCSIKSRFHSLKASPMSAESLRLSPYSCSSNGALSPSESHC